MGTPNKNSTSYLNTSGNGTGYNEGLNNETYDGREINLAGGNDDRSELKKTFVSNIYKLFYQTPG